MKILYFILYLYFNYVICEDNNILPRFIQSYQFKNNLNGDFGLMLLIKPEYGLMKKELESSVPEYCCGNNSRYSNSLLIVNNQYTVSQWFKSTIQDSDKCLNYQILLPVDSSTNPNGTITMTIDNFKLIDTYKNRGFNNITEFKEYNKDPEKYLYCWKLNLNLFKNDLLKEKTLYLSNIGEAWVYIDNVLKFDYGGIRDSNENITLELPDKNLDLKIFKCSRSNLIENTQLSISINGFNAKCDIDPICGTCGESYCDAKECKSSNQSCQKKIKKCGVCISNVPLACDDNDPCTIDSCSNGTCINKLINPDCYCSKHNCFSNDSCIYKECVNKHYCKTTPIICEGNSTCYEPVCTENGQCECSFHQPITTTLGATTSFPNILPSDASIQSFSLLLLSSLIIFFNFI